jgi:alkylation response protein AidB-like acyl-CoA dehydrogenase
VDFNYTQEQQMLADTVERFIADSYSLDVRCRLAASERGFSDDYWQQFAEMGLLGLVVPEQYGGLGSSAVETLIVMQAVGRGLVLEPYWSSAVVAARLIAASGTADQKAQWLPAIADGSKRLALATFEPQARFDLTHISARAERASTGYVVNARKAVVHDAAGADALIVSARTRGDDSDRSGVGLFLIDATTPGVHVESFPNIDGRRSAEVTLRDVTIGADAVLGQLENGFEALEYAVDVGLAALCAEAVGCMEELIAITAEHLRGRRQFGRPIGTFQALQHRIAEMAIATEQARSAALLAAAHLELEPAHLAAGHFAAGHREAGHPEAGHPEADPVAAGIAAADRDAADSLPRHRAVSAAKALIGRSGRTVGQLAVQLHGGMGMTDELAVGHYFKRLTCIEMTWGNSDHHTELFGDLSRVPKWE